MSIEIRKSIRKKMIHALSELCFDGDENEWLDEFWTSLKFTNEQKVYLLKHPEYLRKVVYRNDFKIADTDFIAKELLLSGGDSFVESIKAVKSSSTGHLCCTKCCNH